jgi:alpha-tubulin suppressor-like RCC1 family protein
MKRKLFVLPTVFLIAGLLCVAGAYGTDNRAVFRSVVSAGWDNTFAVMADGSLLAWGYNPHGGLGDGGEKEQHMPVKIMDDAVSISSAYYHSAAVKADGSLWAWGENSGGRLGDGTHEDRLSPVKIMDGMVAVSVSSSHTVAVGADGSLWAWGTNENELGVEAISPNLKPVKIMDGVIAAEAGNESTAVLKADGSLWTWGYNYYGQLGDGTTEDRRRPVKIMGGVVAVSAGYLHTAAIGRDGSLWLWGSNRNGQLGDGTTKDRYAPVKIMNGVAAVSVGFAHTVAVKTDGSLWAWGSNEDGELGDGTTENRYVPVKIMDNMAAVSADLHHTVAVGTDGSLWVWGTHLSNLLLQEDGWAQNRHTPAKILDGAALPYPLAHVGFPIYGYPKADLTEAQVRAAAESLRGILDGEIMDFYKPADDLYYAVVVLDDGDMGGAVLREGSGGAFRVIQADDGLLAEDEIGRYVSEDAATSNVRIDYKDLQGLKGARLYADRLREIIRNADGTKPNNIAMRAIVDYMENVIGAVSECALEAKENAVIVRAEDIRDSLGRARDAKEALESVLSETGPAPGQPVILSLRATVRGLEADAPIHVRFDESTTLIPSGASFTLVLGAGGCALTVSGADLREILDVYGVFDMRLTKTGTTAYDITFRNGDGETLAGLPAPAELALSAESAYDIVVMRASGTEDIWGGLYDEPNAVIRFSTPYSGSYEISENRFDPDDLPKEHGEEAAFAISKGFLDLDHDNDFNPDGVLNRYALAKAFTRMFFALDRSLVCGFTDVFKDNEYYAYVASAEHENLIEGIDNNLYMGERTITRGEAIAAAAATLVNKRDCSLPQNTEVLLASFSDRDKLGDRQRLVALAAREGLILPGESLRPEENITRAEAAVLLYRLFMRLYKTLPLAIVADIGDENGAEILAGNDAARTDFRIPFIAAGALIIVLCCAIVLKKNLSK